MPETAEHFQPEVMSTLLESPVVSEELLLKFVQQCNHVHMTVTKGLPRECKIVGLRRAVVSGNFEIQVHVPDSFSGEDESGIFLPELVAVECAFCSGSGPGLDSRPEGSDRAPDTSADDDGS